MQLLNRPMAVAHRHLGDKMLAQLLAGFDGSLILVQLVGACTVNLKVAGLTHGCSTLVKSLQQALLIAFLSSLG